MLLKTSIDSMKMTCSFWRTGEFWHSDFSSKVWSVVVLKTSTRCLNVMEGLFRIIYGMRGASLMYFRCICIMIMRLFFDVCSCVKYFPGIFKGFFFTPNFAVWCAHRDKVSWDLTSIPSICTCCCFWSLGLPYPENTSTLQLRKFRRFFTLKFTFPKTVSVFYRILASLATRLIRHTTNS